MDFSSSSSSSSSHYRSSSSVSPANTNAPHFPPMEISSSSPQDAARFNYAYHYNYSAGASTAERREEAPDRPPEEEEKEREHMFDKIVTPSDVGKLNRLVIPKQHAEKYFPLDSSSSEKGLLLDFEDRSGKSWRFRYSYWNSSQSYVMTKGWSRFVKEKKLDAGDVVSFQRGVGEEAKDHFYIDWRRRPQPPHHPPPQIQFQHQPFLLRPPNLHYQAHALPHHYRGSVIGYNGLLGNAAATNSSGYNYNYTDTLNYNYGGPNFFRQAGPVVYMRGPPPPQMQRSIPAASSPMVLDSVPVVVPSAGAGQANAGTSLRLFGVNMVTDGQANRSADEEAVEEGRLQLSLIHGGSGESSTTTTDPLDKGKSSMSLDFDL